MNWADAVPNLLIGLREGLEAGLVVSILLAALRKIEPAEGEGRQSSAPIWLGVLAAVMVSGSFAAVLTFSTDLLSSSAQEAVGGSLSVLAVFLVTAMIFWMRRTAASLSRELRGRVAAALRVGSGALALTAFLAVGREGLETTLFLWTAVKASGETVAPLAGAGIGLLIAIALCSLLYRQAVKLNLGKFFNRTAFALIVIAAGVLSYGLGDLQDAGLIPGQQWIAFDLTGHVDPGSWWVTLIGGVTELEPKMTVLQVVAWVVFLAVVVPLFVRAGRRPMAAPAEVAPHQPGRFERLAGRRPWTTAGVLVAVPAAVASLVIGLLPAEAAGTDTALSVTDTDCASEWTSGHAGTQTFEVTNSSKSVGEINLVNSGGGIVGEIETLGPATTAPLAVTLGTGSYTFRCLMASGTTTSGTVQVSGASTSPATVAPKPITVAELTPANDAYRRFAATQLATLSTQVATIDADLARNDLAAARRDWLPAQLTWEKVGASYDSFGDLGEAVDGLSIGFTDGPRDKDFVGLHRLEYGLWHGQSAAELRPYTVKLQAAIATIRKNLGSPDLAGDPTNLPIRVHEIIEDALRDHLSGVDDEGAGAAYAMTDADVAVDRVVLADVASVLDPRAPGIVHEISTQLTTLDRALDAAKVDGRWLPLADTPLTARQDVNAAIGAVLETLDRVPNLLEVPPTR